MSIDRRRFLELGGASLSAALLGACDSTGPGWAQKYLRTAERKNETLERALLSHRSMDRAPKGVGLTGKAFPTYYISPAVPVWDAAVRGPWTLEVGGAVKRPLKLSVDELQKLPSITQRVNHYCVEGWTAVAEWTGVRVSELARLVEPNADVGYVDFESFDNDYHESWDLESATHPQSLIAYAMDGTLLTPGHGAPARLHSPIKLGYKSTKYLTRVVFLPSRTGGYWSDRGYEWFAGV